MCDMAHSEDFHIHNKNYYEFNVKFRFSYRKRNERISYNNSLNLVKRASSYRYIILKSLRCVFQSFEVFHMLLNVWEVFWDFNVKLWSSFFPAFFVYLKRIGRFKYLPWYYSAKWNAFLSVNFKTYIYSIVLLCA